MTRFLLILLLCASTLAHAVTWTQQPGTFYWYKSGTLNKYPTTNPADFTIPSSWVKQNDKIYIQCKSDGGSNRYWEQGLDCYGNVPVIKCEGFMCKDPFGNITFDLTKNSVLTCPRVTITKEQIALLWDGIQHNVPNCR